MDVQKIDRNIIIYINSMAKEQPNTEISMISTEIAKSQTEQGTPVLSNFRVSLCLIAMGFYFLAFAIVQLVTNFSQNSFTADFTCTNYGCSAQLNSVSFPSQSNIYIYLYNPYYSQNIPTPALNTQIITQCTYYSTNQNINKNISLTNTVLAKQNTAYPCGQVSMYYPEGNFTVKSIQTNQYLTVNLDDLSIIDYGFTNKDLNSQWADVQKPRFNTWHQINIGTGLNKYWGYISDKISSNLFIQITTNNKLQQKLTKGLQIKLSDCLALSGYNISLCVFNFVWAFIMFMLGCISFWVISKQKNKGSNIKISHEEMDFIKEQSINQYVLKINT